MKHAYFPKHFESIVALETPLPEGFYEHIQSMFLAVARREFPFLAQDEGLCIDILFRHVYRIQGCGDFEDVERKLRGGGRYFPTAQAYSSFLYVVFKNALREHLRETAKWKRLMCQEDPTYERHGIVSRVEDSSQEMAEAAENVLQSLTPDEQRLLKWRYIEGKTLEGIAARIGSSKSTVDRRLRRIASDKLRTLLDQHRTYFDEGNQETLVALVLKAIEERVVQHP